MIRITSNLDYEVRFPHPTAKGQAPKYFTVKAAKNGKPGVTELEELDSITLNRLRWHYDWRPTDLKNKDRKKDELQADQILEIGLLKFEVIGGDDEGDEGDEPAKPKKKTGQKSRSESASPTAEDSSAAA